MESLTAGSWKAQVTERGLMDAGSLETFAGRLPRLKLPDLVFGYNSLVLEEQSVGLTLDLNAFDALSMTNLEVREGAMYRGGPYLQSHVNYLPSPVRVANAGLWSNRTLPKDSLFKDTATQVVLATSLATDFGNDWTYSTPYKGLFRGRRKATAFDPLPSQFRIEPTEEEIPVERLGRDNPIVWAKEVNFFEDELDDSGSSRCWVRMRAMRDCWFVLLRSYVRVDDVIVRILDTRIFHAYSSSYILREFQVKESSYEQLRTVGFPVNSNWTTAPDQSDLVFGSVRLLGSFKEKVSYS